jgi:hypothetical protein
MAMAQELVEMVGISVAACSWSPSRMMAPLPNCFSMPPMAISMAFSRSKFFVAGSGTFFCAMGFTPYYSSVD